MSLPILVLDANAFIIYSDIPALAKEYQLITHESVICEIKDPHARQKLDLYESLISLRVPSESALKRVKSYAKKTGDIATLSEPDMTLIALAVTIVEKNNKTHLLRKEPLELEQEMTEKYKAFLQQNPTHNQEPESIEEKETKVEIPEENKEDDDGFVEIKAKKSKKSQNQQKKIEEQKKKEPEVEEDFESDEDEDDGKGWISQSNINLVLNHAEHTKAAQDELGVAIMTSDFAMQNVIIQLGIKLLATDGITITRAKRFVLECFACHNITKDTTKQFCPSCGNNTLLKLSCSLNADGTFKFYRKKDHKVRTKGFIYSIPKPKGGRNNQDMILREDELFMNGREYKIRSMQKKKEKEFQKAQIEFENGMGFQRVKQNQFQIKIGHGRKNVNDRFAN